MRTVPLSQPHATLVSLGIQTVLTSNQRIEPGTRVEVKANKRKPRLRWNHKDGRSPVDAVLDHVAMGAYFEAIEGDDWWCYEWTGPLGVVVCTAVVTDCLPIQRWAPLNGPVATAVVADRGTTHAWVLIRDAEQALGVLLPPRDRSLDTFDISDQLPYCDWTKRWAWLLADIEHDIECPTCLGHGGYRLDVPTPARIHRCGGCGGSGRLALPLPAKNQP